MAARTSSVSKPPLPMPDSRNCRNGSCVASGIWSLRFGEHVGGLLFEFAHVAHFHFEFARGELFEVGADFQFATEFEGGSERHFVQFTIGGGEIEQEITEVF